DDAATTKQAGAVAGLVDTGIRQVNALLGQVRSQRLSPAELKKMAEEFKVLDGDKAARGVMSWDHAAQRYLAQVALNRAIAELGGRPEASAEALNRILALLQFPKATPGGRP